MVCQKSWTVNLHLKISCEVNGLARPCEATNVIITLVPLMWLTWTRFLYLARSKLRLCSANHRAGYFSNLACDWLNIGWAILRATDRKRSPDLRCTTELLWQITAPHKTYCVFCTGIDPSRQEIIRLLTATPAKSLLVGLRSVTIGLFIIICTLQIYERTKPSWSHSIVWIGETHTNVTSRNSNHMFGDINCLLDDSQ